MKRQVLQIRKAQYKDMMDKVILLRKCILLILIRRLGIIFSRSLRGLVRQVGQTIKQLKKVTFN